MDISAIQQMLAYVTPVYVVLILIEMALSRWQDRGYYQTKDTFTNIYLTTLNFGLDLLIRGISLGVLLFFGQYKLLTIENPYLYWPLLFLAEDFLFYWLHYVDHYCRLFWAVHVTHHSSEYFNLTTGFRSSVFQPLYRFFYFIPLALLGFQPMDIALMYSATQIYGILVHTSYDIKLGWLEYLLVSPSHHRVHHASNVEYLDKNMGMCLIIWDKIFETYAPERKDRPIKYGLTSPLPNKGPFNIVFHEWKAILWDIRKSPNWATALKYVFMPPGWSHDGSTKTSAEMRRML